MYTYIGPSLGVVALQGGKRHTLCQTGTEANTPLNSKLGSRVAKLPEPI